MIINPYEVKGNLEYEKIIKEFGLSVIDNDLLKRIEKITGEIHPYLKRNIFFAHRDLKFILDEYEKGNKFFLYTGRGPSGKIHLGHLIIWIFTKWLQDKFDVELYFQFTDDEKFLFKKDLTLEETTKLAYDNMLDVIALGFDPKKTHFILDTKHSGLMYPEAIKVAKKITFSTVKSSFGFTNENNIGSIFYTSMQTVPCFLPCVLKKKKIPCLIPHAVDQDPHFRITRDVVEKLGYYKPSSIQGIFLPGLQGNDDSKMSSSLENTAIFSTDSEKEVKNKINKYAFSGGQPTIEEHRKKGGNPDIDISYQYLRFLEYDDDKLKQIYDDYKSGKLLSGELKQIAINKINEFLIKHQKAREEAKNKIEEYMLKI